MRRYKFGGYTITNCGYHQPDHCVWWEACDDDGLACFHGKTLREVEFLILESKWEEKIKAKDREIAELRECLKEAVNYNCATCKSKGKACDVKGFCSERRWRKVLDTTKGSEDEGK